MNIIVRDNLVDYLDELYEKLEKKYGRNEEYEDYLRGWIECIDEVEQFDSGDIDAQLRIYQQTELHNLWVQRYAKMLQEARYLMIIRPHDYLPGSETPDSTSKKSKSTSLTIMKNWKRRTVKYGVQDK